MDEEEDQGSSWESEFEGEKAEEVSRAWRHLANRNTRWVKRLDPRLAFHYLAEDDEDESVSGGLNHLVSRNAAGTPWTWKKVTVVVDSGAAENVIARSMFTEIHRKN